MKIAISSTGPNLESQIDPRFGRCAYFLIVDSESGAFEVIQNEAAAASGGAGIQAAQMIINTGVDAVITGNLGPNATQVLNSSNLKVYLGVSGTAGEAVAQLSQGQLQASSPGGAQPTSPAKAGTAGTIPGSGPSGGMGQG
ncbi:MAG: NifB/NifX family molybdenum-iron cluster-binding protein, partial [Desulfobacterales bacterium]